MTTTKPVFIVGSPRSGTTWLYHLLLSSGGFAIYRSETQTYSRFAGAFGSGVSKARLQRFLDIWLDSEYFRRSGLEVDAFRRKAESGIRSPGDFLRQLMEAICSQQGAQRWAECTPEHGLYIRQIKKDFPEALFIHVVRDGRDVALSLARKGFIRALKAGPDSEAIAAATYWSWITRRIDSLAERHAPGDVLTICYEELVTATTSALQRVADFIGKPIDAQTVSRQSLGSVLHPNTSFPEEASGERTLVRRWQTKCNPQLLSRMEALIEADLVRWRYELSGAKLKLSMSSRAWRALHRLRFEAGFSLRRSRLASYDLSLDWDLAGPDLSSADPTLRPGQHPDIIKRLIAGKLG